MNELFDPTISSGEEAIRYAPRPETLEGLRVGLVENTKHNSDKLLQKLGERLQSRYGMQVVGMNTKQSPSHGVDAGAVEEFRAKADFVVAGIGD